MFGRVPEVILTEAPSASSNEDTIHRIEREHTKKSTSGSRSTEDDEYVRMRLFSSDSHFISDLFEPTRHIIEVHICSCSPPERRQWIALSTSSSGVSALRALTQLG